MRLGWVLGLLLVGVAWGQAPERVVATHYFYWYRWPDQHFDQEGAPGREGHFHHFVEPQRVSYLDPKWHAGEFREMRAAGIDVALPVYWGAPGAYERPNLRFSRDGLRVMVRALAAMEEPAVLLGMFYDTSTLLNDVRGARPLEQWPKGGRADLTTELGLQLFVRTVLEYFEEIPPRLWGRMDGRPLVVLYVSGFAARWDRSLGTQLGDAFEARFGLRPFLVADESWGEIGQDRTTAWGAALHGPKLFEGVAQIGPGYDDSPVPGRRTPYRAREDGRFYQWSWRRALAHRPELVLIETWNEMHEGTEICRTIETGTRYLDLTRTWTKRFKAGAQPGPDFVLRWSSPRARPDRGWGREAEGQPWVEADYKKGARRGLREISLEDGPCHIQGGTLRPRPGGPAWGGYLYLQVSDYWRFDVEREDALPLVLELWTTGKDAFVVHYDSHDAQGTLDGAYTHASPTLLGEEDGLRHWRVELAEARFANRQNGGSDLRLMLRGRDVGVRRLQITKEQAVGR
jgi:hypothetical protein